MKFPFNLQLPWRKAHDLQSKDPYPIVFEWRGQGAPFRPYVRIRRIDPSHQDWDRLVSRRVKLLSLRDKNFLFKPKKLWNNEDQDLAAIWGELLQLPTHSLEMGFWRGDERRCFFREGFNFSLLRLFQKDYVAREVGRFVVVMFTRLDSPKNQDKGTLADLQSEWHQVYVIANVLAVYKRLRTY